MQFLRTTHDVDGTPKTFSAADRDLWSHTPAGGIGHQLDSDRGISLDAALANDRIQDNQDIGSDQAPPTMAEMLMAAAALLRAGMARANDLPSAGPDFVTIQASGVRPQETLHPVTYAVLHHLDDHPASLETIRERINRAYPGVAHITIEQMLVALAELLNMGYASYAERKVAENQTRISDPALIHLIESSAAA